MGWQAGRVLNRDHTLIGGLVRQRRAGDQIADRINARQRCAQRLIDADLPALIERLKSV
jgi:hypothetical protein